MHLLLVEDDRVLGEGLQAALAQEGYQVDWVHDGYAVDEALARSDYALAILDIQLPHRSGLQVLQRLRAKGNATPVLILTARDRCADRVAGLDAGADDYMVKPFDLDELLARLRALVRRAEGRAGPVLGCDGLTLDPSSHQVTFEGEPIPLSRYEFSILQALLENAGRVLSRERLEQILYG
jgi:two-component system response regulator QseB